METVILIGAGAAALGYLAYVAWRGVSGKPACACGGACPGEGGSCRCGSNKHV